MTGDWTSDDRKERRTARDSFEHENWSHLPDEYEPRLDPDTNRGRIV